MLSGVAFGQKTDGDTLPKVKKNFLFKPQLIDSAKNYKLVDLLKNNKSIPPIAMPNAQPKDSSIYLALKGKSKNEKLYKILNAIPVNERLSKK